MFLINILEILHNKHEFTVLAVVFVNKRQPFFQYQRGAYEHDRLLPFRPFVHVLNIILVWYDIYYDKISFRRQFSVTVFVFVLVCFLGQIKAITPVHIPNKKLMLSITEELHLKPKLSMFYLLGLSKIINTVLKNSMSSILKQIF